MAGKFLYFSASIVLILFAGESMALTYPLTSITYPIVDTKVTDFSNDTMRIRPPISGQQFYGQDANYRGLWPSYASNYDGTVSDLVTGLMWQKTMANKTTYAESQTAVKNLRLGGYSDWRIPTIKELYSLILFTGKVVATNATSSMFIDTNYFDQPIGSPRPIDAQTLSGTKYTGLVFGNQACNFGVNFIDGRIKCYPTASTWYFRFVRGPTTYGVNNFIANIDETISDQATGLMWMKIDSGRAMNWQDALSYCENRVFAGRSDWRLPNIKELQSIVDYTRGPQATQSAAISSLFQVTQIKEPNNVTDYPYFWSGTTHCDGPRPQFGAYIAFGQAWGVPYRYGKLIDVHGAGAQRSDPKSAVGGATYPQYVGPQGDMRTVYNYARCVRTM